MKSIRMMTFHTPKNYGAVLQAFGLLTCLKKFSDDVAVIDYDTEHLRSLYPVLPKPRNLKGFIIYLLRLPHYRKIKRKYAAFDAFRTKWLNLTKRFATTRSLYDENWKPDTLFCTGSDQVFNANRIKDERKAFYLDFVPENCTRISYAASFGEGIIPEEKTGEISRYLLKFQHISIRERSGAELVGKLVPKQAPVVLDPVFLCSREEWEKVSSPYRTKFDNYLLYYKVLGNKDSDAYARKMADAKKMKLVIVTNNFIRIRHDALLYDVGPEEFLWLIRNASFVVTDSFHGVALSIVFRKQFVFSNNGKRNNRGLELLRLLGIQEQCYCETYRNDSGIDYDFVNAALNDQIRSSVRYLEQALNESNDIKPNAGNMKSHMKIETIRKQCTGCTACATVCPKNCISMQYDEEGFPFPHISSQDCIQCGACERVCHCLNPSTLQAEHRTYFGASTDDDVLKSSSSGGAFYHLAQNILADNGVVIGAAFDYRERVLKHASTDELDLKQIQKSKYVESDLGNIFSKIQANLDKGRKVLFCGTPCQVSGLKHAVKDPDDLLVTCDFVCHGVPSIRLFQEHLSHLCRNGAPSEVDFRPKDKPWGKYYLEVKSQNGVYLRPYTVDSFFYGFILSAFLRQSCYDCKFRDHHVSDITIADFWGWRKYDPNLKTGRGLSLIIANTEKGESEIRKMKGFAIKQIDNRFSDYVYQKKDYSEGLKIREEFYPLYLKYGFEKAAKMTYYKDGGIREIKYRIKKLLKRI